MILNVLNRIIRRSVLVVVFFAPYIIWSEAWSQTFETGVGQLTTQIVEELRADENTAIAVGVFTHRDGTCSDLTDLLYDEIVFALFGQSNDLRIIERAELGQLFGELRLQRSGAISAETVQEIGNMTGADSLLVGSISNIGDELRLNARVLDADTAQVTSVARTDFSLTDTFEKMISRRSVSKCGYSTQTGTNENHAKNSGGRLTSREVILDNVTYRLAHIAFTDKDEINRLTLEIENNTDGAISFTFWRANYEIMYISGITGEIRVLEYDNRNQFKVSAGNVCYNQSSTQCRQDVYTEVPSGSMARVVIDFSKIAIKAVEPLLIRAHLLIYDGENSNPIAIDFRDVLFK